VQAYPDRLRPELELADECDAVRHQGDHDQRTDDIAREQRDAETHFQRQRHDGRFDGEEQEGERGVDQRGDRRTDIAEARTTGEQVDVDAVFRGVIGDRDAGEKDDGADRKDGRSAVGEAVIDCDRPADRLERQERNGAQRRVGNA
jgi:hypothetical protein